MSSSNFYIGNNKAVFDSKHIQGEIVSVDNERYYKISNFDDMPPFFLSIVSDSDHWLFLSTNGGITAGRTNPEKALFPYVTDDKIYDSATTTGSTTIVFVTTNNKTSLWEPFSNNYMGTYNITRNLYKNVTGNKIIFEEINTDLNVSFKYSWNNSSRFGFVRKSGVTNNSPQNIEINIVDGLQNILPAQVNRGMQTALSTLVDAYKMCEVDESTGLTLYTLSSIPVDRAEPAEALRANIAWSVGLNNANIMLSANCLQTFRKTAQVQAQANSRGLRGAFLQQAKFELQTGKQKYWYTIVDVEKDVVDIVALQNVLSNKFNIEKEIIDDIEKGTKNLRYIISKADGIQHSAYEAGCARHFSNVLNNTMRGGIFIDDYNISIPDFIEYLHTASPEIAKQYIGFLNSLTTPIPYKSLIENANKQNNANFSRVTLEYLPLWFSRRHGDPSRPWNNFSIEVKNADNSRKLYYQGNWRDIFQNWEALAYTYPLFLDSMIYKFVNSSTIDGYNPYRVTRDGFDWELLDLHDPWSFIGYWGDHQLIYLLRLLNMHQAFFPGKLAGMLTTNNCSYANVPYRIKPYQSIVNNPNDSIIFDTQLQATIEKRITQHGNDGRLVWDANNNVYLVNLCEKILVSLLAKITNFIPDAGIWMNTQRPEWNDANNALVGNGASMVTLFHLQSYLTFFNNLLTTIHNQQIAISTEVAEWFETVNKVLLSFVETTNFMFTDSTRRMVANALGLVGEQYRQRVYNNGFSGQKANLNTNNIQQFGILVLQYLQSTVANNKRSDNLYHSYNLVKFNNDNTLTVKNLQLMLEGTVAALSSGIIEAAEANSMLNALQQSPLFVPDQLGYLLYPNKQLPSFFNKNNIPAQLISKSQLLQQLINAKNTSIVVKDENETVHFASNLRNSAILKAELLKLTQLNSFNVTEIEIEKVLDIYEQVFNHSAFTGRSGTFFKFEGLGCIYWHQVSKLQLAVFDLALKGYTQTGNTPTNNALIEHLQKIQMGLGSAKLPNVYGAFPTDPYSHTPAHAGVQQPGMTGQVKEDILARFGQLGLTIANGCIHFSNWLLNKTEFINQPSTFTYINALNNEVTIKLPENTLAYTYCQVPIVYHASTKNKVVVTMQNGSIELNNNMLVNNELAASIFEHANLVAQVDVYFGV